MQVFFLGGGGSTVILNMCYVLNNSKHLETEKKIKDNNNFQQNMTYSNHLRLGIALTLVTCNTAAKSDEDWSSR